MKMKRFILTFAAIAAICAASAAGADEARHFPAPSTVSPEMAAAVDKKAGELWYSEPRNVDEWNKITGGYTEWAAPHAVETAKQLGVTRNREAARRDDNGGKNRGRHGAHADAENYRR